MKKTILLMFMIAQHHATYSMERKDEELIFPIDDVGPSEDDNDEGAFDKAVRACKESNLRRSASSGDHTKDESGAVGIGGELTRSTSIDDLEILQSPNNIKKTKKIKRISSKLTIAAVSNALLKEKDSE
jgi:hypothetical protein